MDLNVVSNVVVCQVVVVVVVAAAAVAAETQIQSVSENLTSDRSYYLSTAVGDTHTHTH